MDVNVESDRLTRVVAMPGFKPRTSPSFHFSIKKKKKHGWKTRGWPSSSIRIQQANKILDTVSHLVRHPVYDGIMGTIRLPKPTHISHIQQYTSRIKKNTRCHKFCEKHRCPVVAVLYEYCSVVPQCIQTAAAKIEVLFIRTVVPKTRQHVHTHINATTAVVALGAPFSCMAK